MFWMPSSKSMCKVPEPFSSLLPNATQLIPVPSLVPSNPKSLLPTFRAACEFAQEYGILVASEEDRPFVPVSSVVLGKGRVPEGVKHAFRKWDEGKYDAKQDARVLPLNESLRATQA